MWSESEGDRAVVLALPDEGGERVDNKIALGEAIHLAERAATLLLPLLT